MQHDEYEHTCRSPPLLQSPQNQTWRVAGVRVQSQITALTKSPQTQLWTVTGIRAQLQITATNEKPPEPIMDRSASALTDHCR